MEKRKLELTGHSINQEWIWILKMENIYQQRSWEGKILHELLPRLAKIRISRLNFTVSYSLKGYELQGKLQ